MENKKFAAVINCIDGRVQAPVVKWLIKEYKVDYVDMITEPGPDKILSDNKDASLIESIKKRVGISVNKHHSELVAITGHYDCAGNPVDEETHKAQVRNAIKIVELWGFQIQVIGLWVDETWQVYKI